MTIATFPRARSPMTNPTTFDDLTFEPPPQWREQKVIAFTAPTGNPSSGLANVTIGRERRAPGESLKTHVQRHLVAMAASLPSYELREMSDIQVAGRSAVILRVDWMTSGGRVAQVSVHVAPAPEDTEIVTLTGTSEFSAARDVEAALEQILRTARWAETARAEVQIQSWDRPDKVWR